MLYPFLVSPPQTPYLNTLPLAHQPPNSLSWHSPTLGHQAFMRTRSSPLTDVQQDHPLLHMHLEPWVLQCVLFGW